MAAGFASGLFPDFMRLALPDAASAEARQQKWHTACFVQSAYRALWIIREPDDGFRNHVLKTTECLDPGMGPCHQYDDPEQVWNALPPSRRAAYAEPEPGKYQIVMDVTYRMRNLATVWFVHRANATLPEGFGAFAFFSYELAHPRPATPSGIYDGTAGLGASYPSDAEMFGLAGFSGRRAFLEAFHAWMVDNIERERTPLEVAEEITQGQTELLADIERMKQHNLVSDPTGSLARCASDDLPPLRDFGEPHGGHAPCETGESC